MSGIASATGLLSARIQPIRRPKPKSVELSGCTRAAPFALRPFAGLFNPYPYGCSVLCNHPADCEAKEVVQRAKDTWVKNSYLTEFCLLYHLMKLAHFSENETFSWHALTLELPPTPRKSEIFICKPTLRSQHSLTISVPPPSSLSSPIAEKCEMVITRVPFSHLRLLDIWKIILPSLIRRIALEEALRVKGDAYTLRGSRQTSASLSVENALRIFSRQAARFELLDSQSLCDLTSLQYLSKHAYVTSGRKLIFGRIFNKFIEEALHSARHISPSDIEEALGEVVGKALTDEQRSYIKSVIGDITQPLGFREWCGLCAAVERLLCPLPPRESDPPTWLERTDFEALERRLKSAGSVDFTLALLLKEIRDR
ncbi:hypothetical protein ALC53_11189 [Atta colombica]|uniref:Uncharacterized protein n=1 Tax=Atta colombica TaxID=520822 RepID=A0A195B2V8_9HYME|nr:hypothetical protein ALC53_11189 [Atta colombica]